MEMETANHPEFQAAIAELTGPNCTRDHAIKALDHIRTTAVLHLGALAEPEIISLMLNFLGVRSEDTKQSVSKVIHEEAINKANLRDVA